MKCCGHCNVISAGLQCFSLASYLSHTTVSLDGLLYQSPAISLLVICLKVQLLCKFQATLDSLDVWSFSLGSAILPFPELFLLLKILIDITPWVSHHHSSLLSSPSYPPWLCLFICLLILRHLSSSEASVQSYQLPILLLPVS